MSNSPAFTLRFRDEKTHHALRVPAELLGVSRDLEQQLTRTAELLRSYRGEGVDQDIEAFAKAEATVDDPLRSRMPGPDP